MQMKISATFFLFDKHYLDMHSMHYLLNSIIIYSWLFLLISAIFLARHYFADTDVEGHFQSCVHSLYSIYYYQATPYLHTVGEGGADLGGKGIYHPPPLNLNDIHDNLIFR